MANKFKTSVGGQALIEGVMMRGKQKTAMAVRVPSGEIDVEEWENDKPSAWYKKTPFVRGIFNFIDMMVLGYKCLMKSAEKSGEVDEPSKFDLFIDKKFGDKAGKVIEVLVMLLGVALAIVLFTLIPAFSVGFLRPYVDSNIWLTVIEGVLKIGILVLYLWVVSSLEDIKRTFQYHGAEHKTIFCYENNEELTVANVRKQIRFHPRCGTSFLFLVLLISIFVFSFITWSNIFIRVAFKILLLPVVVGIGYELIKLTGRYDNVVTKIIAYPGLMLQRLTTKEPDDDQIEVAIASVLPVLPENKEDEQW